MKADNNQAASSELPTTSEAEAIRYFQQAVADGTHWYIALLGSIGLWTSPREVYNNHIYQYLIGGEAFDWLLLAERLCEAVDGILPEDEKNALLFHGIPPIELSPEEVRELIGDIKYTQYLSFFYGITVEEALVLVVQEEIDKEKRVLGYRSKSGSTDEVYRRIYDATREVLLGAFRKENGYSNLRSTTLTEMKEFTYWLFKYRLKQCEKAKIASDTKKALGYLKKQWQRKGVSKVLAVDLSPNSKVQA